MRLHREIVAAVLDYDAESLSDGSIRLIPRWVDSRYSPGQELADAIPFGVLDRLHVAKRVAAVVNAQIRRQRRKGNP